MHSGRRERRPALASAQRLHAVFVGDDGTTLPLSLEWAEQAREQAPMAQQLAAPARSVFVVLSDHTSPRSGVEDEYGNSADAAVAAALLSLLTGPLRIRPRCALGAAAERAPSDAAD